MGPSPRQVARAYDAKPRRKREPSNWGRDVRRTILGTFAYILSFNLRLFRWLWLPILIYFSVVLGFWPWLLIIGGLGTMVLLTLGAGN